MNNENSSARPDLAPLLGDVLVEVMLHGLARLVVSLATSGRSLVSLRTVGARLDVAITREMKARTGSTTAAAAALGITTRQVRNRLQESSVPGKPCHLAQVWFWLRARPGGATESELDRAIIGDGERKRAARDGTLDEGLRVSSVLERNAEAEAARSLALEYGLIEYKDGKYHATESIEIDALWDSLTLYVSYRLGVASIDDIGTFTGEPAELIATRLRRLVQQKRARCREDGKFVVSSLSLGAEHEDSWPAKLLDFVDGSLRLASRKVESLRDAQAAANRATDPFPSGFSVFRVRGVRGREEAVRAMTDALAAWVKTTSTAYRQLPGATPDTGAEELLMSFSSFYSNGKLESAFGTSARRGGN